MEAPHQGVMTPTNYTAVQSPLSMRPLALLFTRDRGLTALAGVFDRFFIVPTTVDAWRERTGALSDVGALLVDVDANDGCTFEELSFLISSSVPVLAITGADSMLERAICLRLGATDAISKPAQTYEMRARLARITNGPAHREAFLHFDGWELLPVERQIFSPLGRRVDLTEGMTRLLCTFFEHPERPLLAAELSRLSRRKGDDRGAIGALVSRTIRRIEHHVGEVAPISRAAGGWILTRDEPNRARGRFSHRGHGVLVNRFAEDKRSWSSKRTSSQKRSNGE